MFCDMTNDSRHSLGRWRNRRKPFQRDAARRSAAGVAAAPTPLADNVAVAAAVDVVDVVGVVGVGVVGVVGVGVVER